MNPEANGPLPPLPPPVIFQIGVATVGLFCFLFAFFTILEWLFRLSYGDDVSLREVTWKNIEFWWLAIRRIW